MTSPPDIEIRPAKDNDDDAAAILRCLATAFDPYRKHYSPTAFVDSTLTNETVRLRLKQMHVLVATLSGNVVGTIGAAWHPEIAEARLRGMAVLPEWQGRGVSAKLLAAIEGWLTPESAAIRYTLPLRQPSKITRHDSSLFTAVS